MNKLEDLSNVTKAEKGKNQHQRQVCLTLKFVMNSYSQKQARGPELMKTQVGFP